jgi:hypothetical protein
MKILDLFDHPQTLRDNKELSELMAGAVGSVRHKIRKGVLVKTQDDMGFETLGIRTTHGIERPITLQHLVDCTDADMAAEFLINQTHCAHSIKGQ